MKFRSRLLFLRGTAAAPLEFPAAAARAGIVALRIRHYCALGRRRSLGMRREKRPNIPLRTIWVARSNCNGLRLRNHERRFTHRRNSTQSISSRSRKVVRIFGGQREWNPRKENLADSCSFQIGRYNLFIYIRKYHGRILKGRAACWGFAAVRSHV